MLDLAVKPGFNAAQEAAAEIDAKMLPRATIWQFASRDGGTT